MSDDNYGIDVGFPTENLTLEQILHHTDKIRALMQNKDFASGMGDGVRDIQSEGHTIQEADAIHNDICDYLEFEFGAPQEGRWYVSMYDTLEIHDDGEFRDLLHTLTEEYIESSAHDGSPMSVKDFNLWLTHNKKEEEAQ